MVTKENLTQGYAWRNYNGETVREYTLAKGDDGWMIVCTSTRSGIWEGAKPILSGLTDDEAVTYLNLILY